MTVRVATEADYPVLAELRSAYNAEFWRRPFPPGEWRDEYYDDRQVLVAEDEGRIVGTASGTLDVHGTGRISHIYLSEDARGQGVGKSLLRALVAYFRDQGAEHVTLGVDTTNESGRVVWQRLGFREFARELTAPLDALVARLGDGAAEASFGSVHVQTDDQSVVERAVARFVPRLHRSGETIVSPARNGWVAVYDEVADSDPKQLRRLGAELSNVTGAIVFTLGVEEGRVVRYIAFDRGHVLDEYLSVPEHYGPLPPGDAIALRANPTLVKRLAGVDASRLRAVARTAATGAELPPPREHLAELADVLGLEGAEHGFEDAQDLDGAVTVRHG